MFARDWFRSTAEDAQPTEVHTSPEEFENASFTLKPHQMFSVHTTPEEFENVTISGHFGFVFE